MLQYDDLLGKPHEMGKADCFSLFRDFYRINYGIEIPNIARPLDWSSDKIDIIGNVYERLGFEKVYDWSIKKLRPGDVLCMAIGTSVPNHLAIYIGGNELLHHLSGQFSKTDPMREFWRGSTCYVCRHPAVPYEEPEKRDVSIMELYRERYKVKAENETQEG